jgi:co-chaperonin GroES (HSP10)
MSYDPIKVTEIKALHDDVLIHDMYFGELKTAGGIVLRNDDGQSHGVRARWGRVYKIGPKQKDVKEGQWILVEHGRWSRKMKIDDGESIKEIQKVDINCILAISDECPNEEDFVVKDTGI